MRYFFSGLLTVACIVLGLVGIINWHWGWILSPLWINGLITIALILIVAILEKYRWC